MRPHRLTLTAFGPFRGTQHVDFDALCAEGLFLLHGATGAGKTSLLDAVCFALYGGVPGSRQQPGGTLRSDHAAPDTLTEVVLDVTVAGRRLEITRRPEQWRPKKTGTGTTRERAHAALREYAGSGEWRPLSRSHQEIGAEIGHLLGMSRDQFCQVALLPQGDFARFLRAGAEERAKLLGRLFHTGRFAVIEDELTGMRKETQARVRHADEELLALAQRMRQAAGPGHGLDAFAGAPKAPDGGSAAGRRRGRDGVPDQRTAGQGPDDDTGTPQLWSAVLIGAALARADAREWLECATLAARAAEERHTAAVGRLEESRELARRQQRHAAAVRRLEQLRASEPERKREGERLARARAADAVTPLLSSRATATAEDTAARAAEREHRAGLPTDQARADAVRLDELAGAARQELGGLEAARHAERRIRAIDIEVAELEEESQRAEEALREAQEWLDDWETTRQAHQRRVERALDAATRAEHLAGQLEPAGRRLSAARRRDVLQGEVQAAEEALLEARERATSAYERWLGLKDTRLRGIATELARKLRPGEPCAVCGSAEHPAPAWPDQGEPGQSAESAENTALADHRRAERAREDASQRLRTVEEQLAAVRAECGDDSVSAAADEMERLTAHHRAAHAEAADAHAARECLERAEGEHQRRTARQHAAEQRAAARTSRREALSHERAALAEQLGRTGADTGDIAERAAALEHHAELLCAAAQAARAARASAERLAEAERRLAEAAERAGFDGGEDAADAVLDEPTRRHTQQRLETWQAAEQAVTAELADEQLTEAGASDPADPEAEQSRVTAATADLREASATEDAALHRRTELERLSARATAQVSRHATLRAAHERITALSQLATGTSTENERRMRLETYVLTARLEQVAAAASVRLARMSAGRYTLVHSARRTHGRGRSGLGLHVVDAWTGKERDTATLSGGETFFASLALALGLADVVTEEAGGTPLDTLFIDEGFGSLDQETLEEVLDVLDSLREQDRSVGIVSHVAELRSRVPAQLQVHKTREGSSVRRRTAPSGG
ncbi:AAA family ATPase [Streptomyces oceani]|uniref:Nuclease SbcCD subunit C n=1 Tax=Streptomyces oceani TaxID=1075402 RepID=A0A1E7JMQ1_9ACTN|nr:SMC family ATPase [Streptomyces oceani]OEU89546.1 exonuclease [Streptomyces oceani]